MTARTKAPETPNVAAPGSISSFDTPMLRRCFLASYSEHVLVADLLSRGADLLSRAADALLRNDFSHAEDLVLECDFPGLDDYNRKVVGPFDANIHGRTSNPVYVRTPGALGPRMPNTAMTREVMARDGYRCRFCGCRIIVKEARKGFVKMFPLAVMPKPKRRYHAALAALTVSIDHLVPFQRGGKNDLDNVVTACSVCQFGRGHCLLDEVKIEDPRQYPPIVDDWDGLTRLRRFDWRAFAPVSCAKPEARPNSPGTPSGVRGNALKDC